MSKPIKFHLIFEKLSLIFLSILKKQVSKFKYVGSTFREDGENKEDIIQRI